MRDLNPHDMKPTRIPGTSKSMNANKNMISLDNHEMNYKLKTSGGFDTMVSEAETLRLEDIEKIKFDLHEEKSNIRYQEDKLNMLIRKFKIQEDKIEEEKRFIQKRKDELVIQERSLLEEKKRFGELAEKFKEEKKNYDFQKEAIVSEIDEVRQNIIIVKSKNAIHEKKTGEYMKKIIELNKRKDYMSSMYSAAFNASVDNNEHPPLRKRSDQMFQDETFQMKSNHERNNSSSIYLENHLTSNNQMSGHKKLGNKDNLLVQIKAEENRINLMEKELEGLKTLEEQLVKEIIEREKKKVVASSTSNPFTIGHSMSNMVYPSKQEHLNDSNPSQARVYFYSDKRQGMPTITPHK